MCRCVFVHAGMCFSGACLLRPDMLDLLELELQKIVKYLTWVLEIKLRSSGRADLTTELLLQSLVLLFLK